MFKEKIAKICDILGANLTEKDGEKCIILSKDETRKIYNMLKVIENTPEPETVEMLKPAAHVIAS